MAYTADCVPLSERKLPFVLPSGVVRHVDRQYLRTLLVSQSQRGSVCCRTCSGIFRWSNNILQSELLMILSFTIGEEIISSTSCVTTIASPKYFRTVLYKYFYVVRHVRRCNRFHTLLQLVLTSLSPLTCAFLFIKSFHDDDSRYRE